MPLKATAGAACRAPARLAAKPLVFITTPVLEMRAAKTSLPVTALFRVSVQATRKPAELAASAGAVWLLVKVHTGSPLGSRTEPALETRAP